MQIPPSHREGSWAAWFLLLFTIQIVPGLLGVAGYEIWSGDNASVYDTITSILRQSESLIIVIATETYIIVESVNMLAEKWKQKRYIDGQIERQKLWEDWNSRRMEAERENRPFNEPPPGPIQNGKNA